MEASSFCKRRGGGYARKERGRGTRYRIGCLEEEERPNQTPSLSFASHSRVAGLLFLHSIFSIPSLGDDDNAVASIPTAAEAHSSVMICILHEDTVRGPFLARQTRILERRWRTIDLTISPRPPGKPYPSPEGGRKGGRKRIIGPAEDDDGTLPLSMHIFTERQAQCVLHVVQERKRPSHNPFPHSSSSRR